MTSCILCTSGRVSLFLDLGHTALANKFLTPEEAATAAEPRFPLRAGVCEDCGHVQLMDPVPPAAMFEDYLYVSGASTTLTNHLKELAEAVVAWQALTPADLVLDVGCNDGTLLDAFGKVSPARRLGIDPAANLEPFRAAKGIESRVAFFNPETAAAIRRDYGPASIITLTNTFPHVPDLLGLVRAFDRLLSDNGTIVIEAHYLGDLVDLVAFDTIYHEHVSYWALGPMRRLFQPFGFEVVHAERLPVHHGQIRAFVQRRGVRHPSEAVQQIADAEQRVGLTRRDTLQAFASRAQGIRDELRAALKSFRASGKQVVGYGAPAKGNTLLTYLGLGSGDLDYIADKSALKQGRVTPGTHIPVVAPQRLLDDQPDYVLLLAWNFADEIIEQLGAYRERGGRFIIPVPDVRII